MGMSLSTDQTDTVLGGFQLQIVLYRIERVLDIVFIGSECARNRFLAFFGKECDQFSILKSLKRLHPFEESRIVRWFGWRWPARQTEDAWRKELL